MMHEQTKCEEWLRKKVDVWPTETKIQSAQTQHQVNFASMDQHEAATSSDVKKNRPVSMLVITEYFGSYTTPLHYHLRVHD